MRKFIETLCIDNIPADTIILDEDIALVTYNRDDYPCSPTEAYKLPHTVIGLCVKGECSFRLNMQDYNITSPAINMFMPGQIIENVTYSPDFQGHAIVVSKRFVDMLNIPGWQQHYMTLYNSPVNPTTEEFMTYVRFFFIMMHKAAQDTENPYRMQVIENLIRVFYYGAMGRFNNENKESTTYKNGLVEKFIELVEEHYRQERLIGFYANKLCITPKYLSKLVKEHTGRSAGEWIENHVILDARAMLHSSDMTIQQIATALNFPNQSFFGKYFKRATGISPKHYRQIK